MTMLMNDGTQGIQGEVLGGWNEGPVLMEVVAMCRQGHSINSRRLLPLVVAVICHHPVIVRIESRVESAHQSACGLTIASIALPSVVKEGTTRVEDTLVHPEIAEDRGHPEIAEDRGHPEIAED